MRIVSLFAISFLSAALMPAMAEPHSKKNSSDGLSVKVVRIFSMGRDEAPIFNQGSPPKSFPQAMMMNQTVWYTPGGVRSHIISMMTSSQKVAEDNSKETRVFDTIAQSGSSNFYQLDEAAKTATRQQVMSFHKMNVMMHIGSNQEDSLSLLPIMILMPGLMQVPPLNRMGILKGYCNLLGHRCEKRFVSAGISQFPTNMTIWTTEIAGRTVLMRVTLKSDGYRFVLIDTISVQVVKTPAHFLELPAGYTIKEAD